MRSVGAILLVVLMGCSGGGAAAPRVPVFGRVTMRGVPLRSGAIAFTPDRQRGGEGPTSRADLSFDGRFILPAGGLPPGWYRITVASLDVALPVRLRDPETAGISREVVAGQQNVLQIELDLSLANR
jgi:hypothetical protein